MDARVGQHNDVGTIALGGEKTYLELPVIDDSQARFFTPLVVES